MWRISEDFFFDNDLYPDCILPCWQGLVVGRSDRNDIQHMFDEAFGFDGTRDFFSPDALTDTISGSYETGHGWLFQAEPPEYFAVEVWLDEESNLLSGIDFRWLRGRFRELMTPQHVIQELGQPSWFLISIAGTEHIRSGVAQFSIIYEMGMAFEYAVRVPIVVTTGPGNTILDRTVELCLGGASWSDESTIAGYESNAYIMPSLSNGLNELSPLQDRFIGLDIRDWEMEPIQQVLNISLDEITRLALQENDACFYSELPNY